jgi:hypothetical protein
VFLDCNVWNNLVTGNSPASVASLRPAYHNGRIEVVGSLELLEERLGTARRDLNKYERLRTTFLKL